MTITAKIIADSISETGVRITTFELEYPRFIHAEFMTHRLFSRNAASSRAIPVATAIKLITANTAKPVHWGKNQPGMSAKEECNERVTTVSRVAKLPAALSREDAWKVAMLDAVYHAEAFNRAGYHKQIVNRLLEPFSHIKVVCTATEYDNFFYLRCHPDAQPEIQELANRMWEAREKSIPVVLSPIDWHVPYYKDGYIYMGEDHSNMPKDLEEAIAISASCCAQVSYRRLDDSLEKAMSIYEKLVAMKPMHASPFEHQAHPIKQVNVFSSNPSDYELPRGVTHATIIPGEMGGLIRDYWSGNFRGWVQNRHLINGNTCWNYDAQ